MRLPAGRILYDIGDTVRYAYFPTNGMVSLLSSTREGATVEVAMVGRNGLVGLPILWRANTSPYQVLVQIACDAYRLRSDIFRTEFRRDGTLQEAVLEHLHGVLVQLSQSSACHRFHSAPARLSRWLLISRDCVQSNTIELSQEFFARMLGIHRKRVSSAALTLQARGAIRQR
ncbi:MAG: Crp/Fnr family transcriptional regulator, partial [Gemmatimonadaceae bacterium]